MSGRLVRIEPGDVVVFPYTLQSTSEGMCQDLLADAGYDPAEHRDVVAAMAFAADLAMVDTAYEVMREHGLKPLADQERPHGACGEYTGSGR